jgi:hypothetical protein
MCIRTKLQKMNVAEAKILSWPRLQPVNESRRKTHEELTCIPLKMTNVVRTRGGSVSKII